jgi:glycosyltransferase 2 family protein
MNIKFGDVIKIGLFAGIGLFLLWYVINGLSATDKVQVIHALQQANYKIIGVSILVTILSHLFRAMRWQLLLAPIAHKPPLLTTFAAVMIAYLANLLVPRLGEVSRCGVLYQQENIPVEKSIGTVITERIIDTLTLLLCGFILLIFQYDVIMRLIQKNVHVPTLNTAKLAMLLCVVLALLCVIYALYNKFKTKLFNNKIIQKVIVKLVGVKQGVLSVTQVTSPINFIALSFLIWFCYGLTVYINFFCMLQTAGLQPIHALAVLVLGAFGFIVVQGGIGAYQLIVMEVLAIYGIAKADGYALGWINWTAQTLAIIVIGILALIYLGKSTKKIVYKSD